MNRIISFCFLCSTLLLARITSATEFHSDAEKEAANKAGLSAYAWELLVLKKVKETSSTRETAAGALADRILNPDQRIDTQKAVREAQAKLDIIVPAPLEIIKQPDIGTPQDYLRIGNRSLFLIDNTVTIMDAKDNQYSVSLPTSSDSNNTFVLDMRTSTTYILSISTPAWTVTNTFALYLRFCC